MASRASSATSPQLPVAADPAFWTHDFSDSSSIHLHRSPTASTKSPSQETNASSVSPPAQTPVQTTGNAQNGSNSTRTSVAVACVPCRSRHLKCDGGVRCSRCKADGVECTYIKSRRGWKGKRKNRAGDNVSPTVTIPGQDATLPQTPLDSALVNGTPQLPTPPYDLVTDVGMCDPLMSSGTPTNFSILATARVDQFNLNGTPRPNQFAQPGPLNPVGAFFFYCYGSHPFILPRNRFQELLKDRRVPLLELAVQYLGSFFLPNVPTEMYKEALNRMLANQNIPKNGYSVQALMLFAIGLHANNDFGRASQVYNMAIDMCLGIGLNRADFSAVNGQGDPVLEESWRRTWWAMYTSNGMFAAVNPGVMFRVKDIPTNVPLPCEDDEYFSGQIPYLRTLQDYDDAAFAATEITFSSYTYLISSIRNLGRVFEASRLNSSYDYPFVDLVDADLVNWSLHLPASKRDIVNNHGQVDELLFQAHMVNAGATITLHRPRSSLGFEKVENVNICVQPGQVLLPTQTREIHTAKCLAAAENISTLIKLPGAPQKHTMFWTCVVVMASVVHLSYWSFLVPDGQDDLVKASIRLDVGVLQQLSSTWPVAHAVLGQVRGVAHTLFNSKKAMSMHLWSSIAHDDVIRNVLEEGAVQPIETYSQLIVP